MIQRQTSSCPHKFPVIFAILTKTMCVPAPVSLGTVSVPNDYILVVTLVGIVLFLLWEIFSHNPRGRRNSTDVKSFASFPNKASKSSTDANPKRLWSWAYSTQLSLPVFEGTPSMVPPVLHLLTALNIYIPPNIAFHYKQGFRTGGMPKLNAQSSGKAASAVSASNSMSTKPLISEQQHFNVVSPSTSLLDAKSSGKDKRELAYSVDLVSVSSVEELIGLSLIPGCEIMKHIPSMRSRFPSLTSPSLTRYAFSSPGAAT